MLESLGCRVDVAGNGRETLCRLQSACYDLILMDCQMPMMDGWEATRKIRANENPEVAGIPVVALTADDDREQCLAAGMDDYLNKPFRLQQLSEIVGRWVGNRGRASKGEAGSSDESVCVEPVSAPPETDDQTGSTACVERGALENIKCMFGAGGRDMLARVIEIYVCDSPALLDRMYQALHTCDCEDMSKAAHALKSSSANLGAVVLAGFCRMVEDIARTGSTKGTESVVTRIREEFERVRAVLEGECQRGI